MITRAFARSSHLLLALAAGTLCATLAFAQVPSPAIEGPITSASPGGVFLQGTSFDLGTVGYTQEEFFISGTASAFTNTGPLGVDGRWAVAAAATASYKTRIVVHRPVNPQRFSGTVIVEWLNVSGGVDAAPDWSQAHVQLIRSGAAWVGVSAQIVGVEGGPGLVAVVSLPLKQVNPARYGSLSHPGDSFSYDIFSQAGEAVRAPSGPNPLGPLRPKRVIAAGESQSAFRLVNYINAVHPIAHVYDGYLVHSRGSIAPGGLSEAPQPVIPVPGATAIRSDLDVPVLTFETESDLTFLGYFAARQADSKNFRLWEVAGTAHADTYLVVNGPGDVGTDPQIAALSITTSPVPGLVSCAEPINSGPQHFVVNAAFAALERWVRRGKAPKSAPRLEVDAGPPVAIVHDANGNAKGGIRTPPVDVPIAAFTGEQDGSILCRLFGSTTPFDADTLAQLYPTHDAFVAAYNHAANRAFKAGYLLRPDMKLMKKWARTSDVGG